MKSLWSVLKLASRASIWRPTLGAELVGLPSLLLWLVVLAIVRIALQYVAAGPGLAINPYGVNAVIAWLALETAVAALFVPRAARTTALSAMVALLVAAEIFSYAVRLAALLGIAAVSLADFWSARAAPTAVFAAVSLWWIGAMIAILRTFAPLSRFAALGRVAALWVALLAVTAAIPHAPVFVGRDFDINSANLWEAVHARLTASAAQGAAAQSGASRFEQSQRALLQAEVARLAKPAKGVTNVYALGVAGWADQDVFLKEVDGGLAALADVLPIKDRTLRLANNRETFETLPLATAQNFAAAVHAIGEVMNKKEDVLLLLLTSHGRASGFGLRFPDQEMAELTPQDVAAVLAREGIKNRVVIVSACFAGIFVPPLANDDTVVVTASDDKNTSFGCAPERDWTYFGDAFFRQSVRRGWDLQRAFDNAKILIHGWELMDRATPSNPQGHFGPALVAKLAPLLASSASGGQ